MTTSREERKITLKEWQDVLAVMNRYTRDDGWVDNENLDKLTFFDSQPSTGGAYVTRDDVKRYIAQYSAKRARVVMVPTVDIIKGLPVKNPEGDLWVLEDGSDLANFLPGCDQCQHLYFVSESEISEKDSVVCILPGVNENKVVLYVSKEGAKAYTKEKGWRRIEAWTLSLTELPSIPQAWIRDVYVPANGKIEEVLLKTVEESGDFTDSIESRMLHCIDNEVVILG
jgi:hypothetical protein